MQEATAVTPGGRSSPADAGIWGEEQADAWERIAFFVRSRGAVPGIQLARKLLRNPHWPWAAARALGDQVPWPPQYTGARRRW